MGQQLAFWQQSLADKKRTAVGFYGEQVAAALFERSGYETVFVSHLKDKRGDLRVVDTATGECWRIEVKTARRGAGGLYQFCLRRRGGRPSCSIDHADYVLLVAALPKSGLTVQFLIPVADIAPTQKQISFRNDPLAYGGKWAKYRQSGQRLKVG